jgi:hypothetical protein
MQVGRAIGLLAGQLAALPSQLLESSAINQEHGVGAALCQGARLTLSLLSATGHLALLQIFAGRLDQRGAGPSCSC